jgi:cytochrome P450
VATAGPDSGLFDSTDPEKAEEQRRTELFECVDYFMRLWNERVNAPPQGDLISMLAHGEATRNMDRMEYLGNLILLIVGGNDTTRNSISGSVYAQHLFPDQERILRADHSLIPPMVSETIRWQTPLAYMRRTALEDVELAARPSRRRQGGHVVRLGQPRRGGHRAAQRLLDRAAAVRQHLSFGFGIHRCVGNRLAELQLKIIWEEILARFPKIEVVGPPRACPRPS